MEVVVKMVNVKITVVFVNNELVVDDYVVVVVNFVKIEHVNNHVIVKLKHKVVTNNVINEHYLIVI